MKGDRISRVAVGRRRGFALLVLWLLSTGPGLGVEPKGLNDARDGSPAARADAAVRGAQESPDAALARLAQLEAEQGGSVQRGHLYERLRLSVLIQAGRLEGMEDAIEQWERSSVPESELALGQARLLRGLLAQQQGAGSRALVELGAALDALWAQCPAASSLRLAALDAGGDSPVEDTPSALLQAFPRCDYRSIADALRARERLLLGRGALAEARADATTRLDLVRAAGDLRRAAEAWAMLAHLAAREGESPSEVGRHEARTRELMARLDDPALSAQLLLWESATAAFLGQSERVLQSSSAALRLARSAGMPRLEVRAMNNLADARLRLGQPAEALRESERGLALARELGDLPVQRTLLINRGVASIALGKVEQALADQAAAEALSAQLGGKGDRALLLREFGEAYAASGEPARALQLFHLERELSAGLARENMEAALREAEEGFEAELRRRELELLQSRLALSKSQIEARDLQLRLGFLASGVLVLLLAGAWMLHRRLRSTRHRLIASRERLQEESERDPLTGLANRRALARWLKEAGDSAQGVLLLMDLDRFKPINDRYGHGAGDAVLRSVAERLFACVREGDLLVRWGGEEFLLLARDLSAARAIPLALRMMFAIADSPVQTDDAALDVRVSAGACCFGADGTACLPSFDLALQIADLALYAAKSRGRARAIAVTALADGVDPSSVIADFELAERMGWIELKTAQLQ